MVVAKGWDVMEMKKCWSQGIHSSVLQCTSSGDPTYSMVTTVNNNVLGQVWWLMPVIPALWEAEAGGSPERSGLRDQNGQPGETPSLLKIEKKLARSGGARL